jgi:transcription factor IIIB subunit 2
VVEENTVIAEVTFGELANGASVLEGQFISADRGKAGLPTIFGRRVGAVGVGLGGSSLSSGTGSNGQATTGNDDSIISESRELTLANGRRRIVALAGAVGLTGEHYVDAAYRWYALALQHQFTRGRRGPNVIAACLYIVCRQEKTPHMLLDFADVLSTSVYSLGGTFLRLVRLLNLEMPIVDPSFFVARFAARLEFAEKTPVVSNTALRLVARMKRDWIQTGRRPAGVCAAGLIIAARMHGFRRTEAQVVRVVRICEATLRKRLEEFGNTPSSQLTPQEFEGIWLEQEADPPSFTHTRSRPAEPGTVHVLPSLLHFQQATASAETATRLQLFTPPASSQEESPVEAEDDDSLSDVPLDEEIEQMLLGAEEIAVKTRYWTAMNQDYLDKEALKAQAVMEKEAAQQQVAAATANKRSLKDGYEESVLGTSEGDSIAARVSNARKSRRTAMKKTTAGAGKSSSSAAGSGIGVAATAAEATRSVLQTKRFSKKINYDALDELFSSTAAGLGTTTTSSSRS